MSRRVIARRAQVTGATGYNDAFCSRLQKTKARSAKLSQGITDRAVVTMIAPGRGKS